MAVTSCICYLSRVQFNTTSYIEFSGLSFGFNMSAAYTFNSLDGYVFGTSKLNA